MSGGITAQPASLYWPVTGSEKYPGPPGRSRETGEHGALLGGGGPLALLDGLQCADRRQDGAGFGFLTAGGAGDRGRPAAALRSRRHGTVAGGSLVEVYVVDKDVSGMVEKVMVRLPIRCTVIKSQRVLVTPAGSLWVLSTWAMTEGGDDEAQLLYSARTRR